MSGLDLVFIGLSLSSSWGNGHATTYRALLRGLQAEGHRVTFLERDVPWYASNRDLADPDFCNLVLYGAVEELWSHRQLIATADAVIVGSYVPDGIPVIDAVAQMVRGSFCFYDIDTPVTLSGLSRGEEAFLARRQVPLFDTYFSFTGGPTLRRLEREFGARHAAALYCAVDETRYAPTEREKRWDLGYLGTYSSDRQPTLECLLIEPARCLPHMSFVVAGPQYPETIDWPANVERIDHLGPADHAEFYARQRFTLNVTRADMVAAGWLPSVRLFEAGACGVPIISDPWPGIDEVLPVGEAILLARSADAVIAALEAPPYLAQRLGSAARTRILSGHTGQARAAELVGQLSRSPTRSAHQTTSRLESVS